MSIEHIWCCQCGVETPCQPEDQWIGAVFQCPACKVVWGCVRPKAGGKAWFPIANYLVQFHDLLTPADPEA